MVADWVLHAVVWVVNEAQASDIVQIAHNSSFSQYCPYWGEWKYQSGILLQQSCNKQKKEFDEYDAQSHDLKKNGNST